MILTMQEREALKDDIHDYFNEHDLSVGIKALDKIDSGFVQMFKEDFEGVEIVSYDSREIEFSIGYETFIVYASASYGQWRLVAEV